MKENYKIILASGSPRRKEIFDNLGVAYQAIPSDKEEHMSDDLEPSALVKELSDMKASDIADKVDEAAIIIGADTVVAHDGHILGKPKDKQNAFDMIKALAGKKHQVFTGVCIIIRHADGSIERDSFHVATAVDVYDMNDTQIEAYIETGEPMDKAGAYAIQGLFAPYIKGIEGDYYNIVGFPIAAIHHSLLNRGIDILCR